MKSVMSGSYLLVLSVLLPFVSFAQKNDAVLKIGRRDSVYSETLAENRQYWVHLPSSYNDRSIQPMKYPVLYILDGNIHFHSLTGMTDILSSGVNSTHVIPEMIVVAILNTDRTRDLTPTATKKSFDGQDADWLATSGGGDRFLQFIEKELIPRIESEYRTIPYRIFVGHSFGGLAVINALISTPKLFNAYVLIDPSVWWDNRVMLNKTADFLASADMKGKSLFFAQANSTLADDPRGDSPFQDIKDFKSLLERHINTGLKWTYRYYDHDNHGSVAFIAEYDALRFIFEDYYAPLNKIGSASQLRKHYQHFSESIGLTFYPPEKVVNELAGIPLFLKRFDVAQEYYQMNIELYPNSPGAYNKMAQLWSTQGKPEKAIEYYKKCLLIDPENRRAKREIENLQAIK
jgi:uncharacterized protein